MHIFHSLSNNRYNGRSIDSLKTSSPQRQSNESSFNFQHLLFSLISSSSCLSLLYRIPLTYILSFVFPLITCFTRQLLGKMWPIQLAFLLFMVYKIFQIAWHLYNNYFLTRSVQVISPAFSSTIFQINSGISDSLAKVSQVSAHYSKCSTLLVKFVGKSVLCLSKFALPWK